jgi:hypothetical protein
MAARRDRERRRPAAERRYQFGESEPAPASDDTLVADDDQATEAAVEKTPRRSRTTVTAASGSTTRGVPQMAAMPFSAFKAEYAYVVGDLRRVALVIGTLLLILLLLYFVLPR